MCYAIWIYKFLKIQSQIEQKLLKILGIYIYFPMPEKIYEGKGTCTPPIFRIHSILNINFLKIYLYFYLKIL